MSAAPASFDPVGAAARRDLYALGARLFATEVDAELYRHLASEGVEQLCGSAELVLVEPGLRQLGVEQALEELAVEYCRLFIGPGPRCPPFASTTLGEALLGGRSRSRLEAFLDLHGVTLAEGDQLASPDHVAVELSVLAHLYDELAAAGPTPDGDAALGGEPAAAAREFLRDHVLTWMPQFLDQVERHAGRALYRSIAQLMQSLLQEERELYCF
jgi:TorA maturation chaperone TorD